MAELKGDVGARHLIGEHADLVAEVAMPDETILLDVDTPQALDELRRTSSGKTA
jgi:molybdenum cofactor cytidylyltransferase